LARVGEGVFGAGEGFAGVGEGIAARGKAIAKGNLVDAEVGKGLAGCGENIADVDAAIAGRLPKYLAIDKINGVEPEIDELPPPLPAKIRQRRPRQHPQPTLERPFPPPILAPPDTLHHLHDRILHHILIREPRPRRHIIDHRPETVEKLPPTLLIAQILEPLQQTAPRQCKLSAIHIPTPSPLPHTHFLQPEPKNTQIKLFDKKHESM
jgi:hypothetical protein